MASGRSTVSPTLYSFSMLLQYECSLQTAVQVAFYLIDLLQDSNAEVVKAADQALTVVSETDESWAAKLRALKFEAHNQVWLEACANGAPQQVE